MMASRLRDRLAQWLLGPAKTAGYRSFPEQAFTHVRDLPLFTYETIRYMTIDPTIRLGLAMRAAPLHQAEFAYEVASPDGEKKWMPGIQSDRPEVSKFVYRQLKRIWRMDLHKLLTAQIWGWAGCEVTYSLRDGMIHVDRLLHRDAHDVFALINEGEVKGVRFKRIKDGIGKVDLRFPKSVWHAFNPEGEKPYGVSILKGAHSPWADKWLDGGALDVRRLFAHKDAYGGVDIAYPAGTMNIDGKGEVPNRDIAREMAEQIKAGAVTTRPSERDENGQERWAITRAAIPANPSHIFDYPKALDVEILRGLEIPDDVLTSEGTGAWQGKQVPMQAFFTNADRWLMQVVQCLVTQVLEPLVLIDFGKAENFEVTTKPLAEQAMEQIQGDQEQASDSRPQAQPKQSSGEFITYHRDGNVFQQRNPHFGRMALDTPTAAEVLVGQGVFDASRLVQSARRLLNGDNDHE